MPPYAGGPPPAADASGDLQVRLLVRGEEAIHGLYGQREPRHVLALIGAVRQITDRPWPRLIAAEAKALAMLGRLVDAADHHGGDSLGWWKPDQVYFARSWVHAAAGSEFAADAAHEQVLSRVPPGSYQYRINARLHEAICTVVRGGIGTGCRQAGRGHRCDPRRLPHQPCDRDGQACAGRGTAGAAGVFGCGGSACGADGRELTPAHPVASHGAGPAS